MSPLPTSLEPPYTLMQIHAQQYSNTHNRTHTYTHTYACMRGIAHAYVHTPLTIEH